MSDISFEMQSMLSSRAEEYYPDVLPYHNWHHALDVMSVAANIADRSIAPEIAIKRNLLVVAAAWHDADYATDILGQNQTKEERSALLAAEQLPELSDDDCNLLMSGIIDTTVTKRSKDSLFGEVLHAADLGYFAAPYAHFIGRLALMKQEWGNVDWTTVTNRTVAFGQVVAQEAKTLMPKILSPSDTESWVVQIEENLQHLQTEQKLGNLE